MKNKNIFIGNLDFATTEEEVKTLLSSYGTVVAIKMRKKKGCAFIEMSDEAEAALAIEKLNGTTFKDREVRISLEIKANKAKALSIKKYNERVESFSRQKKSDNPDNGSPNETVPDSVKVESNEGSSGIEDGSADENRKNIPKAPRPKKIGPAAQSSSDSRRPQRKEWTRDKPARPGRPSHDRKKSGHGGSPRPETNYNSRERFTGPDERSSKIYSPERSDSGHPRRKERSHDKPAYSGRPSHDRNKPGYGGSSRHETNYNSRERFTGQDERSSKIYSPERSDSGHPRRKERSHDKPAYSSRPSRDRNKSGYGKSSRPETNHNSRDRFSYSDERSSKIYSPERSDSHRPRRKEWQRDKPAYSDRPSHDRKKSGDDRSPRPETNYNTRERYPISDERQPRYSPARSGSQPPQKKERARDKLPYPSRHSGPSRQSGAGTRDDSRPRHGSGSPDRFSASSRLKSGSDRKKSPSNSARPGTRGGAGNNDRRRRPKKD